MVTRATPARRSIAGPRRWLSHNGLALATGLAAALPVIVATIRGLSAGWMPAGDQGIIATHSYDVFTSHTPLLGQFSQASRVVGHALYSPGPMLYWLLALPARVAAPASLTLVMGVVNTASIVGVVMLARRRGGNVMMLVAAAAVAAMCVSLSTENLHDIFNPAAGVLPFTLLIFLCWSLACGEYRLLPIAILTASFVAQCHLAFVLPSLAMLAIAVIGLAASARRSAAPRMRRWVGAAIVVGILCWTPPVIDQIVHRPGNLVLVARAATARQDTQGAAPAWRAVVRMVGLPPRWLRRPQSTYRNLGEVSGGDYGDTRLADLGGTPGAVSTASAIGLLGGLVAVLVLGLRRRRRDLAAGAAIGLVLCAAFAVMVESTPTYAVNSLGYTMWWGSAAGMWVWLILAWSVAELTPIGRRLERLRVPAPAAVGAVAALGAVVAVAGRPDAHTPFYRPIRAITARLDATVAPGRTVRLLQEGSVVVPIEPAVRYALRRHGVRALGRGSVRPGAWYALDHRRYSETVSVYTGTKPPVRPVTVVGRVTLTDASGPHPITVALTPVSASSSGSRTAGSPGRARP